MPDPRGWGSVPRPEPTAPRSVLAAGPPAASDRAPARSATALTFGVLALALSLAGMAIGAFCVGFIGAFGAPIDVTSAAMAGFAFWGSVVTAPFAAVSIVCLVLAIRSAGLGGTRTAALVFDVLVVLALVVAVSFWLHPGVHVSYDFAP